MIGRVRGIITTQPDNIKGSVSTMWRFKLQPEGSEKVFDCCLLRYYDDFQKDMDPNKVFFKKGDDVVLYGGVSNEQILNNTEEVTFSVISIDGIDYIDANTYSVKEVEPV